MGYSDWHFPTIDHKFTLASRVHVFIKINSWLPSYNSNMRGPSMCIFPAGKSLFLLFTWMQLYSHSIYADLMEQMDLHVGVKKKWMFFSSHLPRVVIPVLALLFLPLPRWSHTASITFRSGLDSLEEYLSLFPLFPFWKLVPWLLPFHKKIIPYWFCFDNTYIFQVFSALIPTKRLRNIYGHCHIDTKPQIRKWLKTFALPLGDQVIRAALRQLCRHHCATTSQGQ